MEVIDFSILVKEALCFVLCHCRALGFVFCHCILDNELWNKYQ